VNARLACGAMVVIAIGVACTAAAQESVTIALPTTVTFSVPDVSSATPADVDPVTVQFSGAVINPGRVLRISVIANTSTLAGPGAARYPCRPSRGPSREPREEAGHPARSAAAATRGCSRARKQPCQGAST
jgi:hypothetical protein